MEDVLGCVILFAIFGLVLVFYGGVIAITGDKSWLPLRSQLSIRTKDDVRLVGRIVVIIGFVILGIVSLVAALFLL